MNRPAQSLDALMPGCFEPAYGALMISGLSSDSRSIDPGSLFFALDGDCRKGSEFARDALAAGAVAVASDDTAIHSMNLDVPVYFDKNLSSKTSSIAANFYAHPSNNMDVVGITGTNGKTSCAFWLSWMLAEAGTSVGHIGTLGAGMVAGAKSLIPTGFTTPDALQTQRLLADCEQAGAKAVIMEVSSHGLDQGRVAAVHFESAIFTNLSQDHLDYHGDMASYLAAKLKLFRRPELKRAVVNLDDAFSEQVEAVLDPGVELVSFSLDDKRADIYLSEHRACACGYEVTLVSRWGNAQLLIPVYGEYNLSNLLAVSAVALAKGVDFEKIVALLEHVPDVPGRMQRLILPSAPDVVVDYAHTPDAVAAVLQALRPQVRGQLIAVLGCGGDRDTDKRPLMAQAAAQHSDKQIFTSDNPRNEPPTKILNEMLAGLDAASSAHCQRIEDRGQAIAVALQNAAETDLVAVLGRGHEPCQLIAGERIEFDDAEICQRILAEIAKERAAT